MGLIFTNIQHRFRKANKLTCNEYVLADMIYQLSVSPLSKVKGWCYMSRPNMAEEIGISKQSILNLIEALIEKGFIIKDENTAYLKTSRKWNLVYFQDLLAGKESLPPTGKESLPQAGKESLPDNNNLDNTSLFDNKEDAFTFFIKEFNKKRNSKFQCLPQVKTAFRKCLKTHSSKDMLRALENAMKEPYHIENEFNDLTPEFITRADKLEKYLNYVPKKKDTQANGATIIL
jgi:biotin operon repressor